MVQTLSKQDRHTYLAEKKAQGLKRLRKKSDGAGKHAPGAKAHDDYIAFAPGINPRPTLKPSFSAACKAQTFVLWVSGPTKVVP
jgi:hypothetical protein